MDQKSNEENNKNNLKKTNEKSNDKTNDKTNEEDEDNLKKTYKYIVNFVNNLYDEFGEEKEKSIALYNRLLAKSNQNNLDIVKKHVYVFTKFFDNNTEAIKNMDFKMLKVDKILYSNNVFIDIKKILQNSDLQLSEIIWLHLYTILNSINSSEEILNVLNKLKEKYKEVDKEEVFIENLMEKIQKSVNPDVKNPMSAVAGLMSSGILTDVMTELQSGKLDLSKMLGSVTNMMKKANNGTLPAEVSAMMLNLEKK